MISPSLWFGNLSSPNSILYPYIYIYIYMVDVITTKLYADADAPVNCVIRKSILIHSGKYLSCSKFRYDHSQPFVNVNDVPQFQISYKWMTNGVMRGKFNYWLRIASNIHSSGKTSPSPWTRITITTFFTILWIRCLFRFAFIQTKKKITYTKGGRKKKCTWPHDEYAAHAAAVCKMC